MKGIPAYSLLVKVFSGCVPVRCVETTLEKCIYSMVVFGSHKRWDRWHSPSPNWQYIPLIYHLYIAFWGAPYATDPTFYGNQKQPLIYRWMKTTNDQVARFVSTNSTLRICQNVARYFPSLNGGPLKAIPLLRIYIYVMFSSLGAKMFVRYELPLMIQS